MNVRTRWHCEETSGSLSMTGLHAALGSVVPYYAWVPLDLYSTLTRASEHQRHKLLITLRDHTKATFLCCSAYARSRSYRTTAVSQRHADPCHLCVGVQRRRSSSDTHSACRSVDSDLGTLYHASLCVLCHTRCVRPALPILQTPSNSLYSVLTS
jgi:hypothetical protein